jgi:AcrR family transcriptional regulator
VTIAGPIRPRRPYDGSRRRAAADNNRLAVLAASRELLLRDGYQATTVRAIAERAGVSVETIYKSFGGKKQLMKAVYDVTVAGDDEPLPISQRFVMQEILATSDPRRKLTLYGEFVGNFHQRLSPLFHLLGEADPDVAQIRAVTENERLTGLRSFIRHLDEERCLRIGLEPAKAADICWVLTSSAIFVQFTQTRRWSSEAYRQWLTEALLTTLCPAP